MTNLTSAHTLEPGEVQMNVNGQLNLNTTIVRQGVESISAVKSDFESVPEGETVSEETLREAIDLAVAYQLFRPTLVPEAALRVGLSDAPLEGLDAGIRYNGRSPKGDLKLQYWNSEDGVFAGSIQTGVGYQFSPAPSAIEYVTMTEWKRLDFDVMAPLGLRHEEIFRAWVAPRFIYSRVWTSPKLSEFARKRAPEEAKQARRDLFSNESLYYGGLNFGGMIGYKHVFLAAELNVMRVVFRPKILDERRDLSGYTITPAIGLVGRF